MWFYLFLQQRNWKGIKNLSKILYRNKIGQRLTIPQEFIFFLLLHHPLFKATIWGRHLCETSVEDANWECVDGKPLGSSTVKKQTGKGALFLWPSRETKGSFIQIGLKLVCFPLFPHWVLLKWCMVSSRTSTNLSWGFTRMDSVHVYAGLPTSAWASEGNCSFLQMF